MAWFGKTVALGALVTVGALWGGSVSPGAPLAQARSGAAMSSTIAASWVSVQPLPEAREHMAVVAGRNGKIYAFGGDLNSADYTTMFIYYPGLNRWFQGAPMPTARRSARAVTLPDGRIVVLGGSTACTNNYSCTALATVEIYNPTTNTWATAAPMGTARYDFAASLGKDGRVYAMAGLIGNQVLSSVEAYSPTINTWSPVVSMPREALSLASSVDSHGAIIAVGG